MRHKRSGTKYQWMVQRWIHSVDEVLGFKTVVNGAPSKLQATSSTTKGPSCWWSDRKLTLVIVSAIDTVRTGTTAPKSYIVTHQINNNR